MSSHVRLLCSVFLFVLFLQTISCDIDSSQQHTQWLDPLLTVPNPFTKSEMEMIAATNQARLSAAEPKQTPPAPAASQTIDGTNRYLYPVGQLGKQRRDSADKEHTDEKAIDPPIDEPAEQDVHDQVVEEESPAEEIVTVYVDVPEEAAPATETTVYTHVVRFPSPSPSVPAQSGGLVAQPTSAGVSPILNAIQPPCAAARLSKQPVHLKMHAARSDLAGALGDTVDAHGTITMTPVNDADTFFKSICSGHLYLRDFFIHDAPPSTHLFLTTIPATLIAQLQSLTAEAEAMVTFPTTWRPDGPAISQALGNHDNNSALYNLPGGWAPGAYDGIVLYSADAMQVLGVALPSGGDATSTWTTVRAGGGRWDPNAAGWTWPNGVSGWRDSAPTQTAVPTVVTEQAQPFILHSTLVRQTHAPESSPSASEVQETSVENTSDTTVEEEAVTRQTEVDVKPPHAHLAGLRTAPLDLPSEEDNISHGSVLSPVFSHVCLLLAILVSFI